MQKENNSYQSEKFRQLLDRIPSRIMNWGTILVVSLIFIVLGLTFFIRLPISKTKQVHLIHAEDSILYYYVLLPINEVNMFAQVLSIDYMGVEYNLDLIKNEPLVENYCRIIFSIKKFQQETPLILDVKTKPTTKKLINIIMGGRGS